MAKKTKTSTKSKSNKKAAARPARLDQPLRDHLLYLLKGGGAHISFDDAMRDWPVQLAGAKVANFPHTAWMLLEHMRLAQWDILEFTRNPKHVSPEFPAGYWPKTQAPPDKSAWKKSMDAFRSDLQAMIGIVNNESTDFFAPFAHGDGQTVLREALIVADHNAYHLGELLLLRRLLGAWK